MPLQSSGPISLADIAGEFGGSTPHSMSEYYGAAAGLPGAGAISLADFYGTGVIAGPGTGVYQGGYDIVANAPVQYNNVTRFNESAAQLGSETFVGSALSSRGGAPLPGGNACIYAGSFSPNVSTSTQVNTVTRISSAGSLVGSETAHGTVRATPAGSGLSNCGLFYGGNSGYTTYKQVTRINDAGALVGAESTAGANARVGGGGGMVSDIAVFFGGYETQASNLLTTATRINTSGTLVGDTSVVSATERWGCAAAADEMDGVALFWGGYTSAVGGAWYNTVTRINSSGTMVGSETTAGTSRRASGGAKVGANSLFYGGAGSSESVPGNSTTRVNSSGTMVGSETTAGTSRYSIGGAGI